MSVSKVCNSEELAKLKAEKKLTACKCKIEGCDNVGKWSDKRQLFALLKGMCNMHYKRFKKYGNPTESVRVFDGRKKHELYGIWCHIKSRTMNKNNKKYYTYGGRGIKVCSEWTNPINGFWQFVKDMGERPKGFSIERDDVNGDYCKSNCRWANIHTQMSNKTNSNEIVGVSCVKRQGRKDCWISQLRVNGILYRKQFTDENKAIEYRKQLEIEHGIVY